MKTRFPLILILFFAISTGYPAWGQNQSNGKFVVRIYPDRQKSIASLADMNLDYASEHPGQTADVVVSSEELAEMTRRGYKTEIIPMDAPGINVAQYRSYEATIDLLTHYANTYPDILKMDTLGFSQTWNLMIPVLKLSDHPVLEEDEPAILFDGLHHAREPVGMECTLNLLGHLLENYGRDPKVTEWVNENEIWFIPMINPEGYKFLIDNNLTSPWWRKNLRDNNENGMVDQNYDGVDLNRNYDWGWSGGSSSASSITYRGPAPFSESETSAKRQWALAQKPIISLSYHSYGEQIIYTWLERPLSPDNDLIIEIADSMAIRLPRTNGVGKYSVDPSGCTTGFSKCWMYGEIGTIEYTVETANQFIPPVEVGMQVAKDNLQAALYLFERIKGPGITGHITDAESGLPLSARIRITNLADHLVSPRLSDSTFGRYYRLLQPGTYNVRISLTGYETQEFNNLIVSGGDLTKLDIQLLSISSGLENFSLEPNRTICTGARIYPNPASREATIEFQLTQNTPVKIAFIDILGRPVRTIHQGVLPSGRQIIHWDGNSESGAPVGPGLYFCVIETSGGKTRLSLVRQQ